MTNQTIEEAVEDFQAKQKLVEPNGFLADVGEDYEAVDFNMEVMEVWLRQALTTAEARGAREGERKLLEDFAEYAHTRYNGCVHDGEWQYQYNTEVVCMIDDYLKEKLSALDTNV